jgi:hypothetical protein
MNDSATSANAAKLQLLVKNSFWSDMPTNAILEFLNHGNGDGSNSNNIMNSTASNLSTTVHQQQQQQTHHPAVPSYQGQLLALLYPPGLMGGYRNQVIRFTSLCVHAQQNNQDKRDLFLPSLLWVTQVKEPELIVNATTSSVDQQQHNPWLPVPMQDIFDIEHWNSIASQNNSNPLPRIIAVESNDVPTTISNRDFTLSTNNASSSLLDSCWIYHRPDDESIKRYYPHALQRAVWNRPGAGYLNGLYNETRAMIETFHRPSTFIPRRADFLPVVEQHCPAKGGRMMVYGGGKMGGRLWSDAMGRRKRLEKQLQEQNGKDDIDMTTRFSRLLVQDDEQVMMTIPTTMDGWVVRALQPAPVWRAVADHCLVINNNDKHERHDEYLALHARVELEMMSHRCGATMEFNLTKILSQVHDLLEWTIPTAAAAATSSSSRRPYGGVTGILIAVSRDGMDPSKGSKRFHDLAQDNLETLNRLVNPRHTTRRQATRQQELPRAFECGEKVLRDYYDQDANVPDYGTLLQAVVNFHLAVHAKVFVGVQRSSYSTDVWTTRYYLGKGRHNYRYTKNGFIVPVENDGLPMPHIDCATTSDKEDAANVMNLPIRN